VQPGGEIGGIELNTLEHLRQRGARFVTPAIVTSCAARSAP